MEQPLDQYQHTSPTTAQVPIVQLLRGEGESLPVVAQHTPLHSQSGSWTAGPRGYHPIAVATSQGLELSEGRQLCPLWAHLLCLD